MIHQPETELQFQFMLFRRTCYCKELSYNLIFWRWRLSAERTIVHCGKNFRLAFARERSGRSPGEEFFDGLSPLEKAQLAQLFRILGDSTVGAPKNPTKFGVLDHDLYEFKSFQIRMPFGYAKSERGLVLITHGFRKKRDKAPPEEVARAKRILQEDAEASNVLVITDRRKRRHQ